MFVFEQPVAAVLAGLAKALGVVALDRLCSAAATTHSDARDATGVCLCRDSTPVYRPRRIVTFPFPAACRPPDCELASESEKPNRSRPGGSGA